ncbi:MAG: hypothetical protein ACWGPS_05635 [Candidatus Promineifilaceae bacterium]
MSRVVKVKIRPGQSLRFPAVCVSCAQPASERMKLRKQSGRTVRFMDVPVCVQCAQELTRQSMEEERWQRISLVAAGAIAFLSLALLLVIKPDGLALLVWLLFSLPTALLLAAGVYGLLDRKRRAAARPEKKAILRAAQIMDFSWRATVFDFNNDTFAERFVVLNESVLIET